MGTNPRYPAHRLERSHLLDAIRVEVLQLEPVLEEDAADEPPSGNREAALVEGHERDHEPLGARHGLIAGDLPLYSGGEWRKLARLVVWTSLGPLPRWVPGPTTRWAPGTTRLALHGT
jgi:hypothetical protein